MAQSLRNFIIVLGLSLLLLICFTFGACSNVQPFKDGPQKDDIVVGNGSLAVTKGNYLYFANGYKPYADVKDTNKEGNVTYSALYRVKLDENGNPESVDKKYDKDGNEIFDGSRALKNIDILASKVVGFEYTGIYIFGDYIYYATPNEGVDKELTTETQYISFFKRKIDRSDNAEHIYTTKAEGSKVTFNMISFGNNVYLNILDDQTLVVIKNGKDKKEVQKVTGAVFANYSTSDEEVTEFNKDIYFTRDLDAGKDTNTKGNVLCKFSLASMSAQDIYSDNDSTFTLKSVERNNLYYEKQKASEAVSTSKFYSMEGIQNNAIVAEKLMSRNTYSNYYLLPNRTSDVLVSNGSAILLINDVNETTQTVYSGSATVIDVCDGFVYFKADSKIMRVNYQTLGEAETIVSEKVADTNLFCVTTTKLYYISTNQENSSKYLHGVDLSNSEFKDYFVGVLEKADYDKETDE